VDAVPEFVIREAVVEDATAIIAYMKRITSEPDNGLLYEPGEFDWSLEQEQAFIQAQMDAENGVMLVAETDQSPESGKTIIGIVNCGGGPRRANRHTVSLGISVKLEWRNQGVGTALMQEIIQWARETGIVTRIQLDVFETNVRAIHVYEKLGFQAEGTKIRAYYKNGQWIDARLMALLI
jgi:RimJ/RimL family protein N-acetyltransferase